MANSLDDVARQMAEVGIVVPAEVSLRVTDRGFHRFRPEGQKARKKSAWCRIYENRSKGGRVFYSGSFGIRNESHLIRANLDSWTLEERAEAKKIAAEAAKKAEADRRKLALEAAGKGDRLWSRARAEVSAAHPYLVRKAIRAVGLREAFGKLLVPMRRADGALVGLQLILPEKNDDGTDKLFLSGSDTVAAFHVLGDLDAADGERVFLFAEGYATAATLHEASGKPVVVCFNAGNLPPVVAALRGLYPDARFVVCGDDDRHLKARAVERLHRRWGILPVIDNGQPEPRRYEHPELGEVFVTLAWVTGKADAFAIKGELRYHAAGREVREPIEIENAGRVKALEAAAKNRAEAVFPVFKDKAASGTDFNDLQHAEGLEVVRQQLAKVLATPSGSAPARGGSDSGGWVQERYALIYGTDTLWDFKDRTIIKVSAAKLAYPKAIDAWLGSSGRRLIRPDQLVFSPSGALEEGAVNMFDGWPMAPDLRKPHHLIVDHLRMLCGGDEGLFDWVVRWLAYPLQHPGAKMHTALIVHGRREGTGKGIFFEQVMGRIYGHHARTINQALINSDFNGWISRLLFCVADEVLSQAERRHQKGLLKNLITGDVHNINEKNLPVRSEPNLTNLVFLSNEIQPIVLDELDRRYTVAYIDAPQPAGYFSDLLEQIHAGGAAGFYGYLMNLPLGDFGPGTRPYENTARRRLITLGMSPERRFYEFWSKGLLDLPYVPCTGQDLYHAFRLWCLASGERFVPTSTAFLTAIGLQVPRKVLRVDLYPTGYDPSDAHAADVTLTTKQCTVYLPTPIRGEEDPPGELTRQDIDQGVLAFQGATVRLQRDAKRRSVW
ncbi:MAG: DUF5906 domain-containing protein [Stenotrophomonas sp.]